MVAHENTIDNPFLLLLKVFYEMLHNFVSYGINSTIYENCLRIQFWTSGSAPTKKCMKVKVHISRLGTLQVQNRI